MSEPYGMSEDDAAKLVDALYACYSWLLELELEQYAVAFDAAGVKRLDWLECKTAQEFMSDTYGSMTQ